jgi:hypothetical protein
MMKFSFAELAPPRLSLIAAVALCAGFLESPTDLAPNPKRARGATEKSPTRPATALATAQETFPPPGGGAAVTTGRLQGALLDSIRDREAAWAFSKDRFLLKLGDDLRPRALAEKLMGDGAKARRIEGQWRLEPSMGRLVLSDIQSDDQRGRPSVTLAIGPAGLLRVNIDTMQFNVFQIQHLLGRDCELTEASAKRPTRWSFKWNPVLSETGRFTIDRDGEALPGRLVKTVFGEEKPLTRIEGEWRWEYRRGTLELAKIGDGQIAGKKNLSLSVEPTSAGRCTLAGVEFWYPGLSPTAP